MNFKPVTQNINLVISVVCYLLVLLLINFGFPFVTIKDAGIQNNIIYFTSAVLLLIGIFLAFKEYRKNGFSVMATILGVGGIIILLLLSFAMSLSQNQ